MPVPLALTFAYGSLELRGLGAGDLDPALASPGGFALSWDPRAGCHRAPAIAYRALLVALKRAGHEVDAGARRYEELSAGARAHREPRPYQSEALAAWRDAGGRGVVVLPTGAGKTHLAVMAIDDKRRSTLVVTPTLDLVRQWYDVLGATFAAEVGLVGGGDHDVRPLTVTTYDSAYIHMEHLGARFGLVVFDEVHHLPGPSYALAALSCLAPFRLGVTATPERTDGRDAETSRLVGPIVYRKDIVEMSGVYLADYDTETIRVELDPDERAEYDAERAIYRGFVADQGIRMSTPAGFGEFIMRSARSDAGRRAMAAYRRHREIAFAARAKMDCLEHLFDLHRDDRAIVFTQDNAAAHAISRRFLLPAITHETKVRERSAILAGLTSGRYSAVVTSKVLNEGVDVPEANVAIVVSGSASVREHVQRLGRVLRKKDGKRAILYEMVAEGTSETFTSDRRREHSAYR
jgi:superfamily II DNA or RNA helicase